MIGLDELERLRSESQEPAEKEELTDIQSVCITGETPGERLESFLAQVGNPYRYRVGDTVVRVSFSDAGETLEDKLQRYFISLKNK